MNVMMATQLMEMAVTQHVTLNQVGNVFILILPTVIRLIDLQ